MGKVQKVQNKVTTAIRKAKATYFNKMFKEVKNSSVYWNLIKKAKDRTLRKKAIGPLKRSDGSLALVETDKSKVNELIFFKSRRKSGKCTANTHKQYFDTKQNPKRPSNAGIISPYSM